MPDNRDETSGYCVTNQWRDNIISNTEFVKTGNACVVRGWERACVYLFVCVRVN